MNNDTDIIDLRKGQAMEQAVAQLAKRRCVAMGKLAKAAGYRRVRTFRLALRHYRIDVEQFFAIAHALDVSGERFTETLCRRIRAVAQTR